MLLATLQDEALFFHSRRKEKVRQETEAKRWPRRRRRKQRFEIMNEADERESMAALEQRDGSQVEGAVASATFETGFFWKNFRGIEKRTHPGAHWRRPVQTVRASSAIGMERESRRDRCGREAKSGGNFDFSHLKLICGFG